MHGDFSNVTFAAGRQYSGVFDLQGRVGLDANQNEQRAIVQHYLRTAVTDLAGRAAGPTTVDGLPNNGFRIDLDGVDLLIGPGRYYVDGLLVANHDDGAQYLKQPPFDQVKESPYAPPPLPAAGTPYLVYLKVWERHITETEDPALHETALGMHHPDASSRSQVTWRVLTEPVMPGSTAAEQTPAAVDDWVAGWIAAAAATEGHGVLRARARRPEDADENPCTAAPDAGYVGENQLYRVEIRQGGTAAGGATFVWSRDNGSVIYPVEQVTGTKVQVSMLGRDQHSAPVPGDWVEVVDDTVSLRPGLGRSEPAPPLRLVTDVIPETRTIVLDQAPPGGAGADPALHPYLRRWDMAAPDAGSASDLGAATPDGVAIAETPLPADGDDGLWIPLERGIEVQFLPAAGGGDQEYRCGDHWIIPARRVLADVVFDHPDGIGPQGVAYHYAPLATVDGGGALTRRRQLFDPLPVVTET